MRAGAHIVFQVFLIAFALGAICGAHCFQDDVPPAQSSVSLDIIADYERRLEAADAALARAEQDAIREELYLRNFIPDKQTP